jgi:transcription elongation factor GreA
MKDVLPITQFGKALLEEELKRLLQEERPSVIRAIEAARENGDISENADYDAAKERQAWIEARIGEIQGQLAGAEVVDTSKLTGDKVVFGASVVLADLAEDKDVTYQIVGTAESDVTKGKVSIISPLARALVGKKAGDTVEVKAPHSDKEYEIKKVFFV